MRKYTYARLASRAGQWKADNLTCAQVTRLPRKKLEIPKGKRRKYPSAIKTLSPMCQKQKRIGVAANFVFSLNIKEM